jgi:hypothetical protein
MNIILVVGSGVLIVCNGVNIFGGIKINRTSNYVLSVTFGLIHLFETFQPAQYMASRFSRTCVLFQTSQIFLYKWKKKVSDNNLFIEKIRGKCSNEGELINVI